MFCWGTISGFAFLEKRRLIRRGTAAVFLSAALFSPLMDEDGSVLALLPTAAPGGRGRGRFCWSAAAAIARLCRRSANCCSEKQLAGPPLSRRIGGEVIISHRSCLIAAQKPPPNKTGASASSSPDRAPLTCNFSPKRAASVREWPRPRRSPHCRAEDGSKLLSG